MHADIVALEEKKCALLATLIEKLGGSAKVSENEKYDSSEIQEVQQVKHLKILTIKYYTPICRVPFTVNV
jgi:hypothetical protein